MADVAKGKEKEAMKDEARPTSPGETFDRFKNLAQAIVGVPKTEVDRRALAWAKRRRRQKKRS